jgi:hypothetical protein
MVAGVAAAPPAPVAGLAGSPSAAILSMARAMGMRDTPWAGSTHP